MNSSTFTFAIKLLNRAQSHFLKSFREGLSVTEAVAALERLNHDTAQYHDAISLDFAFAPILCVLGTWLLYDYIFAPWGHWAHLVTCLFYLSVVPTVLWDLVRANDFPEEIVKVVLSQAPSYPASNGDARDDGTSCWTMRERLDYCNFVQHSTRKFKIFEVEINRYLIVQMFFKMCGMWFLFWQLSVGTKWAGLEGYRGRVPTCGRDAPL